MSHMAFPRATCPHCGHAISWVDSLQLKPHWRHRRYTCGRPITLPPPTKENDHAKTKA